MCHHHLPQSQEAVLIYEQNVIPITLLGISYSDNMFTRDMKSYHVKEQHKGRYRLCLNMLIYWLKKLMFWPSFHFYTSYTSFSMLLIKWASNSVHVCETALGWWEWTWSTTSPSWWSISSARSNAMSLSTLIVSWSKVMWFSTAHETDLQQTTGNLSCRVCQGFTSFSSKELQHQLDAFAQAYALF